MNKPLVGNSCISDWRRDDKIMTKVWRDLWGCETRKVTNYWLVVYKINNILNVSILIAVNTDAVKNTVVISNVAGVTSCDILSINCII